MTIQQSFNQSRVGKLCERHEQLTQSRIEQANIPSKGSQREQEQQQQSQQSNGGTN